MSIRNDDRVEIRWLTIERDKLKAEVERLRRCLNDCEQRRREWQGKVERLTAEDSKWYLAAELQRKRIADLEIIRCVDNVGGHHRWNGDGQCLDCCNYATDLIDAALAETSDD